MGPTGELQLRILSFASSASASSAQERGFSLYGFNPLRQNPAAPALLDTEVFTEVSTAGGQQAARMAVSPDGTRLAVAAAAQVTVVHIGPQGRLSVSEQPVVRLRRAAAGGGGALSIDWHKGGELVVCANGGAPVIARV